jgi:BlaI family transcriptional regulator, penicillinase repressor
MPRFTRVEEEIMQAIWALGTATVGDVIGWIEANSAEKPANSTISTMLRIMEEKGFLTHITVGRVFLYSALISKEQYAKDSLLTLVSDYFGGSAQSLVSTLVQDETISKTEMDALLAQLDRGRPEKK